MLNLSAFSKKHVVYIITTLLIMGFLGYKINAHYFNEDIVTLALKVKDYQIYIILLYVALFFILHLLLTQKKDWFNIKQIFLLSIPIIILSFYSVRTTTHILLFVNQLKSKEKTIERTFTYNGFYVAGEMFIHGRDAPLIPINERPFINLGDSTYFIIQNSKYPEFKDFLAGNFVFLTDEDLKIIKSHSNREITFEYDIGCLEIPYNYRIIK